MPIRKGQTNTVKVIAAIQAYAESSEFYCCTLNFQASSPRHLNSSSRSAGGHALPDGASSGAEKGCTTDPAQSRELMLRVLNAEVVTTLVHGCVIWTSLKTHFDPLGTVHHRMLLHISGSRRNSRVKSRCVLQPCAWDGSPR